MKISTHERIAKNRDKIDVKRDDILGREICPLEVKGDIYALR